MYSGNENELAFGITNRYELQSLAKLASLAQIL
jgi:hypothetical protein